MSNPGATLHKPNLITLGALAGVSAFTLNTILPALPTIAQEFEVSYARANLAVAGFLAVTAIIQLIAGPLSDRFGRRPLLLYCMLIYIAGSFFCFAAQDFSVFLAGRILQTFSIAGYAVSLALIRDLYSKQEAASRMGYVSATMALGLILGPTLGGFISELFGWRAVFAAYIVLGVLIALTVWFDVAETNQTRSSTMRAQIASYPELFGSRRFWGYALCGAFSVATFYCFTSGVPLVGRDVFGLSPARVGMAMGAITVGFLVGNLLTGKLAARIRMTSLIIAGRCIALFGMIVSLLLLLAGIVGPVTYIAPLTLVGMGNGLTLPSTNSGVVSVRPKLAGSAAGLSGSLAVAIGALLTFLTGIMVNGSNAPVILLIILLFSGIAALLSAIYVRYVDRISGEVEAE